MKIKRLEIIGFKSFQDRAVLDFPQAITGVVGPNGCGKSNVVDAIRWVMGEQSAKNLRGKAMEDVIFNGTEFRKPLGMAEVSLFFSTEDGRVPAKYLNFSEIQVTRRLYRDGESEYLLNKTPCRLLDVAELFMDTGIGARAYSIIEQGKIGMILHAKPEERRFLIEEAAGVTKFKARKQVALKKIEVTRQNLLRIGDIISEIKRQMNGLQRQAKKAERFRELRQELKEIELLSAAKGFTALESERAALGAEVGTLAKRCDDFTLAVAGAELTVEDRRLALVDMERRLSSAQEEIFRVKGEYSSAENRLEFQRRELSQLERQGDRFADEMKALEVRLAEAQAEVENLSVRAVSLVEEVAREEEALADRQSLLEEMSHGESQIGRELDEARRQMFAALAEGAQAANQHAGVTRRVSAIEEKLQAGARERILLAERLEEARQRVDTLNSTQRNLSDRKDVVEEELRTVTVREAELKQAQERGERELQGRREELTAASSRLKSLRELEEQFAGYGQGVRNLLLAEPFKDAPFTMLADALEVEPAYEVPLESVLGERLQYLLCGSRDSALDAVEHLKGSSGGRCTFITAPPSVERFAAPPAGAGDLRGKVSIADHHAPFIEPLLEGAYLASDLPAALALAGEFPRLTFVTLDGDTVHAGGIVNGGSQEPAQQGIIHKKREIKDLAAQVSRLTDQVAELSRLKEERKEQIAEAEAERVELRQEVHRLDIQILNAGKDLQTAAADCRRIEESEAVREMEHEQLTEERDLLLQELKESEAKKAGAEERKVQLEVRVEELAGRLREAKEEMEQARELVTALKVRVASLKEQEGATERGLRRAEVLCSELTAKISSHARDIEGSGSEKEKLLQGIEEAEAALRTLARKQREADLALVAAREGFETQNALVQEEDQRLKVLRGDASAAREIFNGKSLRLSEVNLKLSHLEDALRDRYRMDLSEVLATYADREWDEAASSARQVDLQRLIEEVGEVNLMAIDEFREMEERFAFLTTQRDDLEESMNALQKAIQKINRTTRKRFLETFQQVNDKFQQIFPRLFCGGQAELRLTDEEDLLATGLEIIVQPPGKKLQNVSLLSGGEKALTAVALIFSIFLIKPSPFCLLDEVDAPLDDANIGRFNDMVREMSATSQFIIITHNRATMAVADTLYGVTMEEPGVSKLVSVRLNAGASA
ncbi:chromosome segregation protein SMC [Geomonas sp. RF6]|uniref:chromosome segregation protein SMC n=1 Tax=Geomonas sp. RF6 TaxID=2897342 RepID=UPI001E2E518C|nr:chromosome segregation protein SMC [Geomonas sp. RF6]UFS68760.1 chromosome segregation protein SMC [Geomonas sp. RF6]